MRLPSIHSTFQALKLLQKIQLDQSPGALLVIVPREEDAETLLSDLEALRKVAGWKGEVIPCPSWTHSPYSGLRPSLRVRHERLRAFSNIETAKSVVVSTLPALLQPTLSRDVFLDHCVTLRRGENFGSREDLRQRLTASGYREVSLVEDAGDFALRGEILDVFSVAEDRPLRVEWFDIQVERIRQFDPESQRTLAAADFAEITLPPAVEILPFSAPRLREQVKDYCDSVGIPRQVRDPLVQPLLSGTFPENAESWAPWAYAEFSRFLSWWNPGRIVWLDRDLCLRETEEWAEELRTQFERKRTTEVHCPPALLLPDSTLSVPDPEPHSIEFVSLASPPVVQDVAFESPERWTIETVAEKIAFWKQSGIRVFLGARNRSQASRIRYLLEQRNIFTGFEVLDAEIQHSLILPGDGLALLAESTLLGGAKRRLAPRSRAKSWSGLQALSDLSVDDVVVHRTHGLGLYRGLSRLAHGGQDAEFLVLEYAKGDKLYVPVYRLDEIQKYGAGKSQSPLDRLGTPQFQKAKERARESAKKLAFDLIQLHARRALRPALKLPPPGTLYEEFAARFPFEETEDQSSAIQAVLRDLESERPMDRLVCGDVGFGKTEIAMRAAFRAVEHGLQVVVLVPTTLLAFQHEESFRRRFEGSSVSIGGLSRLKTRQEQKELLAKVKAGSLDILVGTHRALSKDVEWKKLGLIIVDEEHRFGVEHKEKLKTLALEAHMLTLTATPIPRTLQMAMAGIRDLSVISTPPIDRLPVKTLLGSSEDDDVIRVALQEELARDGQVFFLHNRVDTLARTAQRVRDLVPSARVGMAHGQMSEGELESRMLEFYSGQMQVLVCTTIIESGLDLPRANTLLVDQAENLGLAQLYQIRGRVGRSDRRAYCYLLVGPKKDLTREAKERLEIIQRFVELGSGFAIASHDLELRGGGNLLGPEQSGHVAEIGLDLYMELLEEAVRELRDLPESKTHAVDPELKLQIPAYLEESFVPDIHQRLALYRRLSGAESEAEVHALEEEMSERYGPLPGTAENLLWTIRLKILARKVGVDSITVGPEKTSIQLASGCVLSPQKLVGLVLSDTKRYQLTAESKLIVSGMARGPRELFLDLESLFNRCYPN